MLTNLGIWLKALPSNSVLLLNGKYYLNINLTTKSQLLYRDNQYSHYNSYQEFLYNLVNTLKDKGLGYRRISHYLNKNGYKTVRGNTFYNSSVHSIIKKGNIRKERINNLKSHKDYGYEYELSLSDV